MHRDPAAGSKIVYKAVNPYINSWPEYDRLANGKFNRKKTALHHDSENAGGNSGER